MKLSIVVNLIILFIFILFSYCRKEEKKLLPRVKTSEAKSITDSSAISGGKISDDGAVAITSKGVCWSTDMTPDITDEITMDGTGTDSYVSKITGLSPGKTFYVRAYATNSIGTGYGLPVSFKTLGGPPEAVTGDATNILPYSATLDGTVNANDLTTIVSFDYGTNKSYGQSVIAKESPVTGHTDINVSADITGLAPGINYHFRVKTINDLGTVNGSDMTFTTQGKIPSATSIDATNVSSSSATLNGIVNANHLSTVVTFEYGTNKSYGQSVTAIESPVTGNTDTNVSAEISGLTSGKTYHFRVSAVNELGTAYSGDMTFPTP